jgi:hypothetical protein
MRCGLVMTLVTALAALEPASGSLTLEIRVFNGAEEVTSFTRVTVHKAGERSDPLAQTLSGDGRVGLQVPSGIYDVQALHERDGRVVNIRWANRLVVMPYPDEQGHHLEVINFKNGFGALQVRSRDGEHPEASLHEPGKRDKPVATPLKGPTYTLFIVPAGQYDLQVRVAGKAVWQTGLEVPLDRTRLWVIP